MKSARCQQCGGDAVQLPGGSWWHVNTYTWPPHAVALPVIYTNTTSDTSEESK